ncbi:MAG: hypothetical protein GY926_09300 [bacterium]|nr:hypothetical protein [bacterium]
MRLDDLAIRSAKAAHNSTAGITPPPIDDQVRIWHRRSRSFAVLAFCATAVVLALLVGVAGLIGDRGTSESGVSEAATTLTVPTTAASTSLPGPSTDDIEVIAGIDAAQAAGMPPLLYREAVVMVDSVLTGPVVADVRAAASTINSGLGREPVHNVQVVFEQEGQLYTTVEYGADGTGLMVVENAEITRAATGHGTWVDTHIVRRPPGGFNAYVQVTWIGIPDNGTTARLTILEPRDTVAQQSVAQKTEEQAVIGNAAFFEVPKPDWNQTGTLTLEASDGTVLATEEVSLDGGGCSAWRENPNPNSRPSLSEELDAARIQLASAAVRCDLSLMADLAISDGPYFEAPSDSLIDTLHSLDRSRPLMLQILRALQLQPREQELDGRTIYTFGVEHVTLAFEADGTWLFATINDQ